MRHGRSRKTGEPVWTATAVDPVSGENAQLRGLAEVYAISDVAEKLPRDFVANWGKVINPDRFVPH